MIDAALKKGRAFPDWYIDEPDTGPFDYWWIGALMNLATERRFDGGPIPRSNIVEYALEYQLDANLVEPFIHVIQRMDQVLLSWQAKQREQSKNGSSVSGNSGGRFNRGSLGNQHRGAPFGGRGRRR